MKTFFLTLFLFGISNSGMAQTPQGFLGKWVGSGTLMGNEAHFEMKWEDVLNDQFLKLTFENGFSDGSFNMQAIAYYKLNKDGTITGNWFDSRGTTFPLNGTFTSSSITTVWEDSGVERGRTEYKILESKEIQVIDFVLRNGTYQKFAEAIYRLKK